MGVVVVTTGQDARPVVHNARKGYGIAGQVEVTALVGYPGEAPRHVTFVTSVYGGPVVMVTGVGSTFVDHDVSERCGEFGVEWVMRFFGTRHCCAGEDNGSGIQCDAWCQCRHCIEQHTF